jgi:hypothetical protein
MTGMYKFPCGCEFPVLKQSDNPLVMPKLDFRIDNVKFTCPATWALLATGQTRGVFQLESKLGSQWAKRLRPEEIEHMSALGALLRPGCLRAVDKEGVSMTHLYALRKNNEMPIKPYHPAIDAILGKTYNVMTYQEQAMAICQAVAGFTLIEADALRKAIGKKLAEEMAKCKVMFIAGAKKAGILSEEQIVEVFDWIEKSQRYSFNKCTDGQEVIRRPNLGRFLKGQNYTIAEMYKIRNDLEYSKQSGHAALRRKWNRLGNYGKGLSLCEDGRIRPNTILDIQPAGVQPVYEVLLENGSSIRVTINHKFPTTQGIKTVEELIGQLDQGPILYTCGEYEKSDFAKINSFSGVKQHERVHGGPGKATTNGSFTEFKKNDKLIPRVCADCKKKKSRLELHHKNGDRTDSSIQNLERLCVSCHKKREYAAGRTKRGQKGYPSIESKIVSITLCGEVETYDVTMDGPNHNFVTQKNMVTCNSHSLCYGITGYQTAYIKTHFPVQFFTSWLHFAKEKQDVQQEVYDLVNDAKLFEVNVMGPDIRSLMPDFHTDGVNVRFGIGNVKGIGDAQTKKIHKAFIEALDVLEKPVEEWEWYDFLVHCSPGISAAAVTSLIQVGAMRHMGMSRKEMVMQHKTFVELTDKEKEWIQINSGGKIPEPKEPVAKSEEAKEAKPKTKRAPRKKTAVTPEAIAETATITSMPVEAPLQVVNTEPTPMQVYERLTMEHHKIEILEEEPDEATCQRFEFLCGEIHRMEQELNIEREYDYV